MFSFYSYNIIFHYFWSLIFTWHLKTLTWLESREWTSTVHVSDLTRHFLIWFIDKKVKRRHLTRDQNHSKTGIGTKNFSRILNYWEWRTHGKQFFVFYSISICYVPIFGFIIFMIKFQFSCFWVWIFLDF